MAGLALWKDSSTNRITIRAYLSSVRDLLSLKLSFMHSVVNSLRLVDGTLFSIPINLDVSEEEIEGFGIVAGGRIVLRDSRDDAALAILTGAHSKKSGTFD